MPRSHGVIKTEVWEAVSDFRRLPVDAQWAYAMLISQPEISNLGLLPHVPEKWWRLAEDLDRDRLNLALGILEQQRYTITDHGTGELLVRTFIRHDAIWKQPKLVTNARRLIRSVESDRIRDYLTERHPWLTDETWSPDKIRRHETKKRGPETPSDTPSFTPPDTPSETPIGEPVENRAEKGVTEGVSPPRARARDGLPQPLGQPLPPELAINDSSSTTPDTDAAAAILQRLDDLGLNGDALQHARQDPARAQAWIDLAETEADRNPAAFVLTGLRSEAWPSPRGRTPRKPTTAPCPDCGLGANQHTTDCPTLTARLERARVAGLDSDPDEPT